MDKKRVFWQPRDPVNELSVETFELLCRSKGVTVGGVIFLSTEDLEYLKGVRDAAKTLMNEQYPVVFDLRNLINAIAQYKAIQVYRN